MIILAVETSSRRGSAALCVDGTVTEACFSEDFDHGFLLVEKTRELLENSEISLKDMREQIGMKVLIEYEQKCPECDESARFCRNVFTEWGTYSHSEFYCSKCRMYFSHIAGLAIAEVLTDETIICPDEIVNPITSEPMD